MTLAVRLFRPPSLGIAVSGTALAAAVFIGIGAASIAARWATFGIGIGLMLIAYGALVGLGAYLGSRRHWIARGIMVSSSLIHLFVCGSLLTAHNTAQSIGAVIAGAVSLVTLVAAVWPTTRLALSSEDQRLGLEEQ